MFLLFGMMYLSPAIADDWYAYNRDNARSAATDDVLELPLTEAWVYRSPLPPIPAWQGPAKWDGWNKVFELKNRMVFDKVFHVAAVGDSIFFGSSVDDKVYCLDAKTGTVKWEYFTEGPIRLAPSVVNGRVYVGSDDGHVYCLNATTGERIWKQLPGPADIRVPGNGRIVSKWPVRSSVVVVDNKAYCCAGVFSTELTYLIAMDAETGTILWKEPMKDLPAQGYMLASQTRLYVTTGRERPVVFDRVTGKRLFQVDAGGGGTYALLAGDSLLYGPGKTGEINLFGDKTKDQLATFAGNHMIVTADMSYLHTDTNLTALDRGAYVKLVQQREEATNRRNAVAKQLKTSRDIEDAQAHGEELTEEQKKTILTPEQTSILRKELADAANEIDTLTAAMKTCFKWNVPCTYPLSLIRTGQALFAGGKGRVGAFRSEDGEEIWNASVDGDVYGLAAANGRLYVSTDEGTVHCFVPQGTKIGIRDEGLEEEETRRRGDKETRREEAPHASRLTPHSSPTLGTLGTLAHSSSLPNPILLCWKFDKEHVKEGGVVDSNGQLEMKIDGDVRLVREGAEALVFDGKENQAKIALGGLNLPIDHITVEAWVLINKPMQRGAIASAAVGEDGFILVLQGDRFSFALATQKTKTMTTIAADQPFITGRWYHVAGTYDGETMALYVDTVKRATSEKPSGGILYPTTGYLEFGAYQEGGDVHLLEGMMNEVCIHGKTLERRQLAGRLAGKRDTLPNTPKAIFGPFLQIQGPFVEFTSADTLQITWTTASPMTSVLEIGRGLAVLHRLEDSKPKTQHAIHVADIDPQTMYHFRIRGVDVKGSESVTKAYEFDGGFNYTFNHPPKGESPYPIDPLTEVYASFAKKVVAETGVTEGYCLVLDANEGRLAYELARITDLKIIAIERDQKKVHKARIALDRLGIYGSRVSVHEVQPSDLPYGQYFANLIVSDEMLISGRLPDAPLETIYRFLRPSGGVAYLGQAKTETGLKRQTFEHWLKGANTQVGESRLVDEDGFFWVHRRGTLPGAGEWTHQYGTPANNACSDDQLVKGEIGVLWWGEPGPRPMPDRGPRNPAPLFADGRLFVQGNRTFFGLDAYNGTILWSFQAPELRRANMPRDCSNMVASKEYLYIAAGPHCYRINAQTGVRDTAFTVNQPQIAGHDVNWGYVAVVENTLIGSGTIEGAQYLGDQGEWYEGASDHEAGKVTSEYLFAVDRHSGDVRWTYDKGVLINSTVTIYNHTVYFLENHSPTAKPNLTGRFPAELPKALDIVALDFDSGREKWRVPVDYSDLRFMVYLAASGDTLIAAGTDKDKGFHTLAYDAKSGKALWQHKVETKKTHHSGHLSHPTIVGNRLFVNKHTFDLRTGKVLNFDPFDWHGCGTMAASRSTIFHRYEFHGMMDIETGVRTELLGIRSGCWLGLIPAGGLLLAPESSAGCSCHHSIQTSVAYMPIVDF